MRFLRKYIYTLLAGLTYIIVHEGIHLIQAILYDIYQGVKLLPLGIEIEIIQPLTIGGFKLAAFSGLSSITTVIIGYILFLLTPKILKIKKQYIKSYIYYVMLVFLLLDPIYISILSFFVGGDINGIALGLGIPYAVIRAAYFLIAAANIYLLTKRIYPAYVITKQK